MSREGWTVIGPLAYAGKAGCESTLCRRMVGRDDDGNWTFGPCMDWHCSYCDEACGPMGHRCDAAKALLDESRRLNT